MSRPTSGSPCGPGSERDGCVWRPSRRTMVIREPTPTAAVVGRVTLGRRASVWFGCAIRGDVGSIHIGDDTNIQDCSVVHVTTNEFDTYVGARVTVGHGVILHGCQIDDDVLVGMGAVVMDGARIESGCWIAAGSLVTPGTHVPKGSLALGRPARVTRRVTDEERAQITLSVAHYVELAAAYLRP